MSNNIKVRELLSAMTPDQGVIIIVGFDAEECGRAEYLLGSSKYLDFDVAEAYIGMTYDKCIRIQVRENDNVSRIKHVQLCDIKDLIEETSKYAKKFGEQRIEGTVKINESDFDIKISISKHES